MTLLHVSAEPLLIPPSEVYGPIFIPVTEEQILDTTRALEELASRELPGLSVTCEVERGDPGPEIACFAKTHNMDLIALATHGYGPFRRFLLGSVATKVLHDAHCPVLTGAHLPPSTATDGERQTGELRQVLCCVDTLRPQPVILREAAHVAHDLGARASFVHVVQAPEAALGMNFGTDWETEIKDLAHEQLHEQMNAAGVEGDLFIRMGKPGHGIAHLAQTLHADLLVQGNRLSAPTADLVLREAPCPVLNLPVA